MNFTCPECGSQEEDITVAAYCCGMAFCSAECWGKHDAENHDYPQDPEED